MENYKRAIKNRNQYALTSGTLDIGLRLAAFRWVNNGWQRPYGGFETNHVRKLPGSIFASLITAPLSIPFEMARMTYYADKTFPKELQRGYTSFFNALRRIPFEEGPYWLFKNSFPFFARNFFQTFTLFYSFDFMKDKMSFTWRVGEMPYEPVKAVLITISAYLASIFSYPFGVTIREMVDFWPKEKGGICTWDNNYRKAAVWLWYHEFSNTMWPGMFNNYFWRNFPWMFGSVWIADKLGMFTYQSIDLMGGPGGNSWEDSFS